MEAIRGNGYLVAKKRVCVGICCTVEENPEALKSYSGSITNGLCDIRQVALLP